MRSGRLLVACLLMLGVAGMGAGAIGLLGARADEPPPAKTRGKAKKAPNRAAGKKAAPASSGGPVETAGASWPQFLGPQRNNIAADTGLMKKWPAEGPPLLKTISGLGVGFSNLSIADGIVYTMGNRGAREFVLAFSLETGQELWAFANGSAYHNGYGDGPRGTPTIDGDKVYALGASGDLVCLDRAKGTQIWKKSLVREFGASIPTWGICESPLIDGENLVCTPGGRNAVMVALDKAKGNPVWRTPAGPGEGTAYASILPIDVGGVRQYVNYTAGSTIGVRARDGELMWRDSSSANPTANCCTGVFGDGMVLTASGYGKGASMLRLASSGDATKADFAWHTNKLKVHHGGLVLLNGFVYGCDEQILTCVELKSGDIKWQNRSVGKGSLTCADGMLIVRSEQGPVALVEPSPSGYKEVSRFSQPDRSSSPSWTYPVVCAGKLFLRDQEILQIYDISEK